jgi:hypothetical protein
LRDAPDLQPSLRINAACNALAGRLEQAQKSVVRLQQLNPTLRVSNFKDVLGPYRPENRQGSFGKTAFSWPGRHEIARSWIRAVNFR